MLYKTLATLAGALVLGMAGAAAAQVSFKASYDVASLPAPASTNLVFSITNATAAPLTNATFVYNAPIGTSFAGGGGSITCGSGATLTAGSVTFAPATIPAGATCLVTIQFVPTIGTHGLAASSLSYTAGGPVALTAGANPSLTVGPPAAVPTLSEWAMILLGLIMAGGAALAVQRRARAG